MNKRSLKVISLIVLLTLISINIFNASIVAIARETTGDLSVSEALSKSKGTVVTAEGYIVAKSNEQYALKIADTNDVSASEYLIVKLEASMREEFSPVNNQGALGKKIKVTGKRDVYSGEQSIEFVSAIEFIEGSTNNGSVSAALKEPKGIVVTAEGYIVAKFNEQYAIKIADTNDASASEYLIVKLEVSMREKFSPVNNSGSLGKK